MKVTQRTLLIIAAFVWYAGGIALLFKGSALIRSAHSMDPQSFWAYGSGPSAGGTCSARSDPSPPGG